MSFVNPNSASKVIDVLKTRMSVSFETFPPKDDRPLDPVKHTIDRLMAFQPDFISCTYGAGGTNKGQQKQILQHIASKDTITMANYSCIENYKENILATVSDYMSFGVTTFLALRGDFPLGKQETGGDFHYGCQMVAFLKKNFPQLEVAGGCYPEKHLLSRDMDAEITYLRIKQDAGADFVVAQLCHDLDNYCRFVERARKAGVTIPIIHGLMPVLSKDPIINMTVSNGCSIPKELAEIIGKYGSDPAEFKKAGKDYTVRQIQRLVSEGVDGLHIFTLNKFDDTAEIVQMSGIGSAKN